MLRLRSTRRSRGELDSSSSSGKGGARVRYLRTDSASVRPKGVSSATASLPECLREPTAAPVERSGCGHREFAQGGRSMPWELKHSVIADAHRQTVWEFV